jgi:hypothetical protein
MTAENFPVRLVNQSGSEMAGEFVFDEMQEHDCCNLTLRYALGELSAKASDYFEAMCEIRKMLESDGWRPHCYGASRNVYPSGMSRDMGRGLQAYKLELGQKGKTANLVGIFATGEDVVPSCVEQQLKFWTT